MTVKDLELKAHLLRTAGFGGSLNYLENISEISYEDIV